jgi:hypothetical protein
VEADPVVRFSSVDGAPGPRGPEIRLSPLALALVAFAVVMALPLVAAACPVCAGRSVSNPYAQAGLIGGFVFFPFGVVYTVVRYIRNGLKRVDGDHR